ncbi:hypothetical protein [Streptomyces luteogriseus]|uniref:hypothetical protein n=1 Tax=Streptomyces luteogriseus TaxID=68233 RepID=UPI00371D7890
MSDGMEAARRRADEKRYAWPSEVPTEAECEEAARQALSVGYQQTTATGEQEDSAGPVRPGEEPGT